MKRYYYYLLIILLFLFSGRGFCETKKKVVLINSDASLEKFSTQQEEFKNAFSHQIVGEVDLGQKKWKKSKVKKLLYNEYPDLIYAIGAKAYLTAKNYVTDKPIVFSSIINWERFSVSSKTYGVSNELHTGMQITIIRHIFPNISTIGVLYSNKYNKQWFEKTKTVFNESQMKILGGLVMRTGKTEKIIRDLLKKVDAMWIISDPFVMPNKYRMIFIMNECDKMNIPVFSYDNFFVEIGAVLTVSVDHSTVGRQAADIATQVLNKKKLSIEGRVVYPMGSYIILNMKKIKKYNLPYNERALDSVNYIVE